MSGTPSPVAAGLRLAAIASHPLMVTGWIVGALIGWPMLAEVAYMVEIAVAGSLAFGLRPWLVRDGPAKAPPRVRETLDGFQARVGLPWASTATSGAALIGAAVSTTTWVLGHATLVALFPERWLVGGKGLLFGVLAVGMFGGLHFALHTVFMVLIAWNQARAEIRRSTQRVELVGRVLRVGERSLALRADTPLHRDVRAMRLQVGEGDEAMQIEADPGVLRWVEAQVEAHRPAPEAQAELPPELARLLARG